MPRWASRLGKGFILLLGAHTLNPKPKTLSLESIVPGCTAEVVRLKGFPNTALMCPYMSPCSLGLELNRDYRDNGKEAGKSCLGFRVYRAYSDTGKENGNYCLEFRLNRQTLHPQHQTQNLSDSSEAPAVLHLRRASIQ